MQSGVTALMRREMAYEQIEACDKLSATWRLLAEQMISLGYQRSDMFETMTAIGLSFGLNVQNRAPLAEEDAFELQLPRADWDFDRWGADVAVR
jgi:hypothetical protein